MIPHISFIQLESVPSTLNYALEHYREFDPAAITCVSALEQTAGRGRYKKPWVSPKGNLFPTFYFTASKKASDPSVIPQVFVFTLLNYLEKMGIRGVMRWPNDVLVGEKKLSGVLAETVDLGESFGVALGVGINVNLDKETLETIDQPATSLLVETGRESDPNHMLRELAFAFSRDLALFFLKGFSPFHPYLQARLAYKGQNLELALPNETITAQCVGLASDGRLQVQLENGEAQLLHSAEVLRAHSH